MPPGSTIAGRYRLGDELGRGAFATTYAGERLSDAKPVAIKALDLGKVRDWKTVELFEREARVLRSLDHPRIPDYVEFVSLAEDRMGYLVQELALGRSLAAMLAEGRRFTRAQLRDIAEQLLEILVYLTELLPPVVHRDIKPSNILLDDAGQCRLVDFGSVRDVITSESGGSTVAGTFGYMAPEQLHGEAGPSSDLYGLGMTLIHLATGREPSELPRKRLTIDVRGLVSLDEPFAAFLDGLIQPAPEDRFANPRVALAALHRGSSTAAIATTSPSAVATPPPTAIATPAATELETTGPERSRVTLRRTLRGLVLRVGTRSLRDDATMGAFTGGIVALFALGMVNGFLLDFVGVSMAAVVLFDVPAALACMGGGIIHARQSSRTMELRIVDDRYEFAGKKSHFAGAVSDLRIAIEPSAGGSLVSIGGADWNRQLFLDGESDIDAFQAVAAHLDRTH